MWYLALVYLKLRKWKEARALTINSTFIHQCYNSSIEEVITRTSRDLTILCPWLGFGPIITRYYGVIYLKISPQGLHSDDDLLCQPFYY
ncbi:hypothetical protein ACHAXR_000404 [Thalassiosira sp. AJA248-18]